jgi:N-sulfoglucosamine sulfohydrolase
MKDALNIVVVICHDLGQHLGCYGQPDVRSPNIDAFASTGTRFENSFCTAPQCSPARAALWTGRFPHANGVVGLSHAGFANDLKPDEKHLVQILRGNGYETCLFGVQHEAVNAERCGYEYIHGGGCDGHAYDEDFTCSRLADGFLEFIKKRKASDRPLFAQIGFFEPHRPFPRDKDVECLNREQLTVPPYLPDIPEIREDLADMEASIHSADRAFGRIVEAIRSSEISDDTLIVFTADHGIPFPYAKMTLRDAGLEVPLILSGPGIPEGVREEMISHVDVLPTLLDLTGIPCPQNLHGRSFFPLMAQQAYVPNEYIFGEKTYHTYYDPMRAVRSDRWKLIANFEFTPLIETSPDYFDNGKSYVETAKAQNLDGINNYRPPYELYNLSEDPFELNNLADDTEYLKTRDRLIVRLHQWMKETVDPLLNGAMMQGGFVQRMDHFKSIGMSK